MAGEQLRTGGIPASRPRFLGDTMKEMSEAEFEEAVNYQLFGILEQRTDLDAYFRGGHVDHDYGTEGAELWEKH